MCYHEKEVNPMEHENQNQEVSQYTPRPAWQVWMARIGLVVFIIFLIFYYLNFFGGTG